MKGFEEEDEEVVGEGFLLVAEGRVMDDGELIFITGSINQASIEIGGKQE